MRLLISLFKNKNIYKLHTATYLANFFDHFDTAIYGFLVPILAPLFFPKSDPVIALIQGYGVLIIGFITRPLGAWYFSKQAETISPPAALVKTIQGMTLATLAFVFVQPYAEWGIYGALSLCLLRGIQNFFAAGETSIAGLYLLEQSNDQQQHTINSIYLATQMGGILLAGTIANLIFYLPQPALYWKWPFYGACITGICGWCLRKQIMTNHPNKQHIYTKKYTYNWRGILYIAPIAGLSYLTYSAAFVFFNSFAALLTNINIAELMSINTILMVYDLILLLVLGKVLQKYNSINLLKFTCLGIMFLVPILFYFLPKMQLFGICFIRLLLVTLGVIFCIPLNVWYTKKFQPYERYSITALGYALGSEVIGRSFPALGLVLWHYSHLAIVPGLYIALIAILALWSLINF